MGRLPTMPCRHTLPVGGKYIHRFKFLATDPARYAPGTLRTGICMVFLHRQLRSGHIRCIPVVHDHQASRPLLQYHQEHLAQQLRSLPHAPALADLVESVAHTVVPCSCRHPRDRHRHLPQQLHLHTVHSRPSTQQVDNRVRTSVPMPGYGSNSPG